MHKRPSRKDIIQMIVLTVLVLLVVVPGLVLKKDHPFRTSSVSRWLGGVWLILTAITLWRVMSDHPFILHPWDEPSDEDDEEENDDEEEDEEEDEEKETDSAHVSDDDEP